MGDHKVTPADKLPPQIINAFKTMKPGDVSGLIQIPFRLGVAGQADTKQRRQRPIARHKHLIEISAKKVSAKKVAKKVVG